MTNRNNKGFTIVELMVGLLLAAFSILITLTLYTTLIKTSIQSHTDSQQDGQLASAIATMQLEIQSAGYGVPAPNNTEMKLVDAQHINWRYQSATGVVCRGFWVDNIEGVRTLRLMKSKNACTLTTDINNIIPANWESSDPLNSLAAFPIDPPAISMTLNNAVCTPYGVGVAESHKQLVISAQSSVSRATAAGAAAIQADTYSFCIANIIP